MRKNVLILSSSPRKGGNSETLAAAFAKGAQEAGNQVETVYLREMQYGFCKGCLLKPSLKRRRNTKSSPANLPSRRHSMLL